LELTWRNLLIPENQNDIACNGGPNPTTATNKVINVAAGSTVQATWRHTLTSGPNDVIDASHKVYNLTQETCVQSLLTVLQGPVIAYMKKVGDATKDVGYGPGWFKISEAGLTNAACKVHIIAYRDITNINFSTTMGCYRAGM